MTSDEFLNKKTRAEDIILGSLGLDIDAHLVSIQKTNSGFSGLASWPNGETFSIISEDELSPLEIWALDILLKN